MFVTDFEVIPLELSGRMPTSSDASIIRKITEIFQLVDYIDHLIFSKLPNFL